MAATSHQRPGAHGDIDEDGDPDLPVTYCGGRARLFRNDVPKRGHWLKVRAIDPRLHRDAYGAEVTVNVGDRRLIRLVNPASGYLGSNDLRPHFGLGASGEFDAIHVLWPDGLSEVFPGGKADRMIVLRRGEGRSAGLD
ncbi:MAG: ASPIC/UnbV domain-containing protein [Planctomycetota bacterium]|nr:ASPIC/UnbV domain-containing protein [Planctomycetota bacterium]